ncbi:hypothetical protein SAMN06264348_101504 [Oceanospirillum linum]|nr:hypothetical protein SAMN04489856_101503 [Oleiphilus messinensis]SMP05011.1 hypothetical protein SAMN06264348_101504 [Oceanospirillum linum]
MRISILFNLPPHFLFCVADAKNRVRNLKKMGYIAMHKIKKVFKPNISGDDAM